MYYGFFYGVLVSLAALGIWQARKRRVWGAVLSIACSLVALALMLGGPRGERLEPGLNLRHEEALAEELGKGFVGLVNPGGEILIISGPGRPDRQAWGAWQTGLSRGAQMPVRASLLPLADALGRSTWGSVAGVVVDAAVVGGSVEARERLVTLLGERPVSFFSLKGASVPDDLLASMSQTHMSIAVEQEFWGLKMRSVSGRGAGLVAAGSSSASAMDRVASAHGHDHSHAHDGAHEGVHEGEPGQPAATKPAAATPDTAASAPTSTDTSTDAMATAAAPSGDAMAAAATAASAPARDDADVAAMAAITPDMESLPVTELRIVHGRAKLAQAPAAAARLDDAHAFRARLAIDGGLLLIDLDVTAPAGLDNAAPDPQRLFQGGNAIDLLLATDPAAKREPASAARGDLRLLITRRGGKPLAMLYRPLVGKEPEGVAFRSLKGRSVFASIKPVNVTLDYRPRGGGFAVTAALKLADLGWTPQPGQRVGLDLGYIFGDAQGAKALGRKYWRNVSFSASVINDVAAESRLEPEEWGSAVVE